MKFDFVIEILKKHLRECSLYEGSYAHKEARGLFRKMKKELKQAIKILKESEE